jgi:hypothetical protein
MKNKPNTTYKLIEIRSDLQKLLVRLDEAIAESSRSEPHRNDPDLVRSRTPRMQQTYIAGYDFREDRRGFAAKIDKLMDRVNWVDENSETLTDDQLRNELQLRTAEARLLQTQCTDRDGEWNALVTAIRTLTRITTDERPGFIYGLAANHTTDWGKKIEEVLARYSPANAP